MKAMCLFTIIRRSNLFTVLLLTGIILSVAAAETPILVDNILAVQLDGTCNPADISQNFIFSGGDEFFGSEFESTQNAVKIKAASIHEAGFTADRPASSTVISSALQAIRASSSANHFQTIQIILGQLSGPLFCYEGARRLDSCTASEETLFEKSRDTWDYRYDCDGWKAIFTSVVVGFSNSQFLKYVKYH